MRCAVSGAAVYEEDSHNENETVIKEFASFVAQSFLTRLNIISTLHHFVSTDRTVGLPVISTNKAMERITLSLCVPQCYVR